MAAAAHDLVEMLDSACCECFNAGALLRRDPFVATSAGALRGVMTRHGARGHEGARRLEKLVLRCAGLAAPSVAPDDEHPLSNALAAECRDDAGLRLESDVDEGARVGSCTEKDAQTLGVDSPQRASLLRRGTCHPQIPAAGQGVVHLN